MKYKVKTKPLSVNKCWQGRRFKTQEYGIYEKTVGYLLPKGIKIPKGSMKLAITFGLPRTNCDIDNPVKPFLDILQKQYGFNDKHVYHLDVKKVDVKKGKEFIEFELSTLSEN